MATTVVNPPQNSSNNGTGFLLGIIVLIVLVILFFVYGLPYIQSYMAGGGVEINIPENIDVNLNKQQ
ncbi:MAG: hypothetical protein Q8P26_03995 [Candidatus Levybacteria bacterium]|nr:hypothetical protein [Candidatus Levybacteria bacterium]